MSITWQQLKPARHTWFMSEAQNRRLQKSLSDLNGRNANIQGGTVEGVMRELCNAFIRRGPQPGVPQMLRTYLRVRAKVDEVMQVADAASMFEARVFKDLCFVARAIAQEAEWSVRPLWARPQVPIDI